MSGHLSEESANSRLYYFAKIPISECWHYNCLSKIELLCSDNQLRTIPNAASSSRWPNNVVPYVLDAAFTTAERAIIAAVSILKLISSRERSGSMCAFFLYLYSPWA
jgi:hypothetical protein